MLFAGSMRRALGLLLVLSACARPTAQDCERVIDRYVDMKIGDDSEVISAPEAARQTVREIKKAEKRTQPAYGFRVDQCMREVDTAELACGMSAPSPNEWEACFH